MVALATTTVDIDRLTGLKDQGYLTFQRHPRMQLWIWNYTPKCQYERYWTPETLMCRGLITDFWGKIRARPLPKFFNLEEHQGPLPAEPFEVYEKLDGSLGILYYDQAGDPCIASRGSFTSEQAERANRILDRYHGGRPLFRPGRTYLFEILYPENRIVVDYGDWEDLVLLAVIETATGKELPLEHDLGFPVAKRFDGLTDVTALKALAEPNREGFVVKFQSGLRLKVKFEEYIRLHRIVTGLNERAVWEHLSQGGSIDDLLRDVPEEFEAWGKSVAARLQAQYDVVEAQCEADFKATRRAIAAYYQTCTNPVVLFKMLDGKPYADLIWKDLKPEAGRTFRTEEEE